MLKNFRRIALMLLVAFSANSYMQAQMQMPPIPVDQDVRIGKLPNGLTYYIRHNEKPQGQADFYIAQRVGSILEEENQRGLAHFLEHMCFNGTTNYPGTQLRDWLESIGVKFGANLNASTGIDETIYLITNVPVARQSVQDSCLLILHDWANEVTLDPGEIDKERGVIHEEWRRSMNGSMRAIEKLLPIMYPNSKYGYCLPIGTIDVIDNFTPQEIRDYYETWYRPDNQGIIVVGDIDVDYIEGKIKEMFSDIEMPANAKERIYYPVEDNEGIIYAIGSDPEQSTVEVDLMFKTDAVPAEQKGTMDYLLLSYIMQMIESMLDNRLNELGQSPDAPYAQASANYGDFFVAKTKDALTLSAIARDKDIMPGFEAAYRELLRAQRGGFTIGEYERARAEYLSRLERAYNGRDKRENREFVNAYVKNFTDNEPMPSIEDRYMIMQQIVPMIPVEAINGILPELITENNRVLLCLYPDKEGYPVPTEAEFAAIMAKVEAEDIEPYKDTMKEEPLIPTMPVPGKVVSVTDDAQWGAKVVTLSNGVKVVVKTTDFKPDEILFRAFAIGGTNAVPDDKANEIIYMPYGSAMHGFGNYNNIDMQKYLQGKQASVDLSISGSNRELAGSSTVKDLPTLFEMIYMSFIDYSITADEYAAFQNQLVGVLQGREEDPTFIFNKVLLEQIFESPAKRMLSADIVKAADRGEILNIVHGLMLNAAEYTFYFVGDVTVEQLTPYLELYIASLPAVALDKAPSAEPNLAREPRTGKHEYTTTAKMETPQTWCLILYTGSIPYTLENQMMFSMMGQILSNRLIAEIREEMGATYSISAEAEFLRSGVINAILEIPFPMKPELKDQVLAKIHECLWGMTSDIKADELNPIKEYMAKTAVENLSKNNAWINSMVGAQENGVDTFHNRVETLDGITVEKLEAFVKAFLEQNNSNVIILDPAE